MRAAVLGAGVIGAGWAARMLLHGWDVVVWDPAPASEARVAATVDQAETALAALYPLPARGQLSFAADLEEAVAGAGWIQESIPEQLAQKRALFETVSMHCGQNAVIASSTSGFKPSVLAELCERAAQVLVCHPFNPVYLVPGVEVVPSSVTSTETTGAAMAQLKTIGMQPVLIRQEIDAHVADRLLEAVWREALWLIRDGIATTGEVDQVIKTTFGLRWAQMGLFETYRLGGGDDGFRHFLAQFGPALHWPWSRLTDVPELDDALIDRIVAQSDAQADGKRVAEMVASRDRNLVALLKALRAEDQGAGQGLNAYIASRQQPG